MNDSEYRMRELLLHFAGYVNYRNSIGARVFFKLVDMREII